MTKIIILNNKKCQIVSEDLEMLKRLRSHLSFRLNGVEYTISFQNGWSGITYLLTKNNKFDLGLLEKVKLFLENRNIQYDIEDKRKPKIINPNLDISKKLKQHSLIPREHQIRIVDLVDQYDKGIIRAATGSGKSLCTALITAKLNKPTIIYVIGLDLLDQFHKLFTKLFDEKIGYIGNGICDPQNITIASIWTIGRALNNNNKNIVDEETDVTEKDVSVDNRIKIISLLQQTKVHIFDESHVVTTNTILDIYKIIDPEYIYGFSGTPFRDDGSDLLINGILGEQIINVSASELIEKGLLSTPIIKFISVPKMRVSSQYQSVYKEYIVENCIRNNLIVKHTQELLNKSYTPLILFKQIKHGNILFEEMKKNDIKCEMLYGDDSLERRNEIKNMLINKKIDAILASTIFDLGVDIPELSGLILCGGGKSSIRSLQRIGRVIRPYKDKKYSAIIDFYDQVKFLKNHSMTRHKVYSSENGFKIIKSREMK